MNKVNLSASIIRLSPSSNHGGNVYGASETLGIPEESVIDFSASINPLGVPESVVSEMKSVARRVVNYPDPDTKELRLEIAGKFDIDPDSILCGNGSTELIYLMVRALRPAKVLIPNPTFTEYERACRTTSDELKVMSYKLRKETDFHLNTNEFIQSMSSFSSEMRIREARLVFLCNPNNPTGGLLRKNEIITLADAAKAHKCYLVVDEAFMDFLPEESAISEVENNPYLIILRSMTKFYALTGLRLGYGIFPPAIMNSMRKHKEPWSVNTLAQRAGVVAINDIAYGNETFSVISAEKRFLEEGFRNLGIEWLPSSVNYYLLRLRTAEELAAFLFKKGILVRSCANFSGLDGSYIRIAVKSRRENERLLKEISPWLKA